MKEENAGKPRRVLVVEDNDAQRRFLELVLSKEGYLVSTAADGDEALVLLDSHEFQVAIVDKGLPGALSGLDILHAAGKRSQVTRTIVITAHASKETVIEALQGGAFDYLEKPAAPPLIVEKVRRAWDSSNAAREHSELFRQYETLFEAVPGIVWFVTQDGMIRRINRDGAALLGYTPEDLEGAQYTVLVDDDNAQPDAQWVFKERRTGARATRRQVIQIQTRTGATRLFDMTATGAYEPGGTVDEQKYWGTLGVGWDVTASVALEQQLEQARRMEALGRLAGGVAHDFNNLLTVILNNVELLRLGVEGRRSPADRINDIEEAAKRAADLTRDLLTLGRRDMAISRPVRLGKVMRRMESMLRRLIQESIELQISVDGDLGRVEADESQMERVIVNLVTNARDAMPNGGRLTVQLTNAVIDSEFAAAHRGLVPGAYVMLAVTDTGEGMPPEVSEHIFEPFFTTKEQGKGTGLGMATSYAIVDRYKGIIDVRTGENVGTTIKVFLPRFEGEEEAEAPVDESFPTGGSGRILLVEDEDLVRRVARRILMHAGYEVAEASDGAAALSMVEELGESDRPFEMLVTDVVMPKMSGPELVQALKKRGRAVPVVYMSGYMGGVHDDTMTLSDDSCFVRKPFTATTLARAVKDLFERLSPERTGA